VIQLYDRDAVEVSALLAVVADDIFKGDTEGTKSGPLLESRNRLAKADSAATAADHPSQQGPLAAARLKSIVASIEEQLPPERRASTANAQRP